MNFLKEVKKLDVNDKDGLEYFIDALEFRLETIEDMEPQCDGETYDRWEERYSDMEDIVEDLKEVETQEELNKIEERLKDHQFEYGGLLRFRY